jgi:hypothetical protein
MENYIELPQKLKLSSNPAPGAYTKKMLSVAQRNICTLVFIVALFTSQSKEIF